MAEELGISNSVRFLGKVSHDELPRYYASADVFVGPSVTDADGDTEGLGVVFLEAAASEVPIIGASTGGISEFLIDGLTGLQVTPKKPEELASQICRLLRDPEMRRSLGKRARQRAVDRFSWDRVARDFSGLFQETIHRAAEGK